MIELSVIICTHNPRSDFIGRTIKALELQDLAKDRWELVLIDNASNPPLTGQINLDWHPNARMVSEPQLGLTHARLRGIEETSSQLLVFVDDDNVLAPDYLTQALSISIDYSQIGAFGGQCLPDFVDEAPPEWTRRYWNCLGIWEFSQDSWSNRHDVQCIPCGAGLIVRSAAANAYSAACKLDTRRVGLDRHGKSLVSGGDYDLALCAVDLGSGMGKFHRLKLHHLMPSSRFEEQYLLRLWRAVHCSGKVMGYLRYGTASRVRRSVNQRIRRLIRLMTGGWRDVHFRFGVAAEKGLKDADKLIASLGRRPFDT